MSESPYPRRPPDPLFFCSPGRAHGFFSVSGPGAFSAPLPGAHLRLFDGRSVLLSFGLRVAAGHLIYFTHLAATREATAEPNGPGGHVVSFYDVSEE